MYNEIYVGIDPAPAATGLSFFIPEKKLVETYSITSPKVSGMGNFMMWYLRSQSVVALTRQILQDSDYEASKRVIVMETPPPVGQFSAGLMGLDFLMLSSFNNVDVILTHCKKIYSLIGYNGDKKDVREVVEAVAHRNNIVVPFFKTDHESDATIYALWAYYIENKSLSLPEGKKKSLVSQWTYSPSLIYEDSRINLKVYT